MRYLPLIFILSTATVYSAVSEPPISDYARGIELVTEQQAAIYKLTLPEQVYAYIRSKNLNDVRVFNQSNEPVPHIIRSSKNILIVDANRADLPYFPISAAFVKQVDSGLGITVSNEGKVLQIQFENAAEASEQQIIKYYLIDASHLDEAIESIDIQLAGGDSSYAKAVKLEYSHDLNHWMPLVNKATLTNLEYGNYILKNTTINLPNKRTKYLRFSWLDEPDGLTIESIKANSRNQYLSSKKHWSTAKLIQNKPEQLSYELDTGGAFNIEQLDIQLPEDNTLIDVIIESRINNDSPWRKRFTGVFYRLYLLDAEITSDPVNIRSTRDRYWRIRLQSTDGIGKAEPILKYAWRPDELFFLARGKPPFVLAYGNTTVSGVKRPKSLFMDTVEQNFKHELIGNAKAGREIEFKGNVATVEKLLIPWKKISLWLVLIVGVIVIGVMVFRLSQQMRNTD